MPATKKITIGSVAGHHFNGQADMTVARHCWRGKEHGVFVRRKWLYDRTAFHCDPRRGWAYEHWFEWDGEAAETKRLAGE